MMQTDHFFFRRDILTQYTVDLGIPEASYCVALCHQYRLTADRIAQCISRVMQRQHIRLIPV